MQPIKTIAKTARPALYISVLAMALLGGLAYGLRANGIFACQSADYYSTELIAYCHSTAFGDYDHGAFWFDLEPDITTTATASDVLFLGNSRMQFGLSSDATDRWFRDRNLDYYLLGFSHNENHLFVEPLLDKLKPRAAVLVINVDQFFVDLITDPANDIMNNKDTINRYRQKRTWQRLQSWLCNRASWVCRNESSYVRSRTTGAWRFVGTTYFERNNMPNPDIEYASAYDPADLDLYATNAKAFVKQNAAAHRCIVLTNVPNRDTSVQTARGLADRLGLPIVLPSTTRLTSFDGSHLDRQSAERWSADFLQLLGPEIDRCLNGDPA